MVETMNQRLTHKKPNGDTDRDRYHRSPDIDTIGIGRDTARLRETGLSNEMNVSSENVAREMRRSQERGREHR
jgi:hypothetical protein